MNNGWINRTPWTEEKIELLKTLWAEGFSCSRIAVRIPWFTRNAIIGKVNRLGLPPRVTTQRTKAAAPRRTKKSRNKPFRFGNGKAPSAPKQPEQGPQLPAASAPVPTIPECERVPFLDTKFGQCRFILDEQHRCCGRQTKELTGSWCPEHHRVVFLPVKRRPVYAPAYHTSTPKETAHG